MDTFELVFFDYHLQKSEKNSYSFELTGWAPTRLFSLYLRKNSFETQSIEVLDNRYGENLESHINQTSAYLTNISFEETKSCPLRLIPRISIEMALLQIILKYNVDVMKNTNFEESHVYEGKKCVPKRKNNLFHY